MTRIASSKRFTRFARGCLRGGRSALNCFGLQIQLLTGEYVPMFTALILYIYIQAQLSGSPIGTPTALAMVASTVGRVAFAARAFGISSVLLMELGATVTYLAFGGLIAAAVSYSV